MRADTKVFLITWAGIVLYAGFVLMTLYLAYHGILWELDKRTRTSERLQRLEHLAWLYLPPTDCSHCHNLRIGPVKEVKPNARKN